MSLLTLPTEILHRILDNLDIHSILVSFRRVCSRFYTITESYHRYELNLCSMSRSDIKLAFHLVQPENVISLVLTNQWQMEDKNKLFFEYYKKEKQFHQIRSLTVNEVASGFFEQLLQFVANCPLSSVAIHTHESWLMSRIPGQLASILNPFKIRKLNLSNFNYLLDQILWTQLSTLHHLTLEKCTYPEYRTILSALPDLKTLLIKDCMMKDNEQQQTLRQSYRQLTSLTISDGRLSMDGIKFLVSQTPSLVYLKLGWSRPELDSIFDGAVWEEFIENSLTSLTKFEFLFSSTKISVNDVFPDVDALIDAFRTPFWLNNKRCFVTCDYNIARKMINLYTTPIRFTPNDDLSKSIVTSPDPSIVIRWRISSTDASCSPTLVWTNGMFDITATNVGSFPGGIVIACSSLI